MAGIRSAALVLGAIPARTGEPHIAIVGVLKKRAYPRTHGGTPVMSVIPVIRQGLSPHARGNHLYGLSGILRSGPIPARTGEPCAAHSGSHHDGAYPRTHGGTIAQTVDAVHRQGLSPHARGNPDRGDPRYPLTGPIPARTGEPLAFCESHSLNRAYPRTHGGT